MLEILREHSQMGMELAQLITHDGCHDNFLECLWAKKEECPGCLLVEFRKEIESQSPAFFKAFILCSEFDSIKPVLEKIKNNDNKDFPSVISQEEISFRRSLQDIRTFAEASMAALYPLFLANGKNFPFLREDEISEIKNKYISDYSADRVGEEFRSMSDSWFSSFSAISASFFEREKWAKKVYFLVRIFLVGAEKEEMEAVATKKPEEKIDYKDNLIDDVEKFLNAQKKPPDENI